MLILVLCTATALLLPSLVTRIMDVDSARRQFLQQLRYGGRILAVARHDHGPF